MTPQNHRGELLVFHLDFDDLSFGLEKVPCSRAIPNPQGNVQRCPSVLSFSEKNKFLSGFSRFLGSLLFSARSFIGGGRFVDGRMPGGGGGSCIYWRRVRVMSVDPRMIHLYSFYRDAELRGATLLLKLLMRVEDSETQVKLSRHLADETRHAWLWTKKIVDLGATPVQVSDGYQTRIGQEVGIPKTLTDLFALTVVVEERAQRRYLEHARRPDVDPDIRELLHEVTKDEKWHIGWIKNKLREMAAANGGEEKMLATLERYREIDRRVVADLVAKERAAFGFSFSDGPGISL
jgi:rubrerythrin